MATPGWITDWITILADNPVPSATYFFVAAAICYAIYQINFTVMDRRRVLLDVGFKSVRTTFNNNSCSSSEHVRRHLRTRKLGDNLKPPYPNGWVVVAESKDVTPGRVLQATVAGDQVLVTRTTDEKGSVSVVDPYCPHLGANMIAGGVVKGDCIQCPFHNWSFNLKTGKCTDVPYAKKAPNYGSIRVWQSLEMNQLVFVWYHADGEKPQYRPTLLPQVDDRSKLGAWTYHGRNEYEVACQMQEIPENGADVAHLAAIHKDLALLGGEPDNWITKLSGLVSWHDWTVSWKGGTDEDEQNDGDAESGLDEHEARVHLTHEMTFWKFKVVRVNVIGDQIGPSLVHLHVTVPGFGWKMVMLQYIQTVAPMTQKLVHVLYTEPGCWTIVAKIWLLCESWLVERDIAVWNHKSYLDQPLFATKEDRIIKRFRNWYSQFYSPSSLTFKEAAKKQIPLWDW